MTATVGQEGRPTPTLLWHDPEYEEFTCAGCHCPAFRPVKPTGRRKHYCCTPCQAATANRRARARQREPRDAQRG